MATCSHTRLPARHRGRNSRATYESENTAAPGGARAGTQFSWRYTGCDENLFRVASSRNWLVPLVVGPPIHLRPAARISQHADPTLGRVLALAAPASVETTLDAADSATTAKEPLKRRSKLIDGKSAVRRHGLQNSLRSVPCGRQPGDSRLGSGNLNRGRIRIRVYRVSGHDRHGGIAVDLDRFEI